MSDSLVFTIRRGDTRPNLRVRVLDDEAAVDLTLATTVRLLVRDRPSNTLLINGTMTKEDQTQAATKGYAWRAWQSADTATVGSYALEVQVEWADGGIQTFPADQNASLIIVRDLGP